MTCLGSSLAKQRALLLRHVRSINETENCNVIISSNLEENVFTGAVITCDGGDLPYVKENVKNAVCALLDIGANKVCVIANK